MIQTFRNKALGRFAKGIPKKLEKRIRVRLEVIDSATVINDLNIPGYDLHELKGDRKETWLIRYQLTGALLSNLETMMPTIWILKIITRP